MDAGVSCLENDPFLEAKNRPPKSQSKPKIWRTRLGAQIIRFSRFGRPVLPQSVAIELRSEGVCACDWIAIVLRLEIFAFELRLYGMPRARGSFRALRL